MKKGVLRNLAKFNGKHLYQSFFFNKVAGLRQKTPFLQSTSGQMLLNTTVTGCTFLYKSYSSLLSLTNNCIEEFKHKQYKTKVIQTINTSKF